ncbi:hypothetical protein [Allopusillimonas ginsengisoli]|uniref:hypothetical protein n=1 Tax=Allopusillimonas ginsengisoli TaxID=453575 RepID=UPI00102217E0|nr:hypothetical protein [Allopusillimonas ginsengisoli]TEA79836.1 hypothetical protein ERE07_02535 [Allopusillimonas ginsengisoli]
MSKGKSTPFRGSRLFVQQEVSETTAAITAITATNPGTVTTSAAAAKGDIITIAGLPGFDGQYVVASVASGTLTLADADWSDELAPEEFDGATVAKLDFLTQFCELTGFNHSGSTVRYDDASTICSGDYDDFDAVSIDSGTLQLDFNFAPAVPIQEKLREYERTMEKFWVKVLLPRSQGTMAYYGGVQNGPGMSGSATESKFTSGVTLKLSGPYFHIKAA